MSDERVEGLLALSSDLRGELMVMQGRLETAERERKEAVAQVEEEQAFYADPQKQWDATIPRIAALERVAKAAQLVVSCEGDSLCHLAYALSALQPARAPVVKRAKEDDKG